MDAEKRLDLAEQDIRGLRDRQDKQADAFEQLRSDLAARLSETEARQEQRLAATEERLETQIAASHNAVVGKIGEVEEHLSEQDEMLRSQFIRDDDLISARFVWPSWRYWIAFGLSGALTAFLALHFH